MGRHVWFLRFLFKIAKSRAVYSDKTRFSCKWRSPRSEELNVNYAEKGSGTKRKVGGWPVSPFFGLRLLLSSFLRPNCREVKGSDL